MTIQEKKEFIKSAIWGSMSGETLEKLSDEEIEERFDEIQDKYREWEWDVISDIPDELM